MQGCENEVYPLRNIKISWAAPALAALLPDKIYSSPIFHIFRGKLRAGR